MDVKVQCTCGQAYQFEVEPVNNLMPCAVNCPACGADGTQLANESIAQSASPAMAVAAAPAYSAPPSPGGLRINRPPPPPAAPAAVSDAPAAPQVAPGQFYPPASKTPKPPVPSAIAVPMGILGGVIAGGIGMGIWYSVTIATDMEFGIAAWFLGALTGVGVRVLARDGSPVLGYVAAVCACLSILGGEFLAANTYINRGIAKGAEKSYAKQINAAREAVKANTDVEITTWLENQGVAPGKISQAEIENFRDSTKARMQRLLDGSPSLKEYQKIISDRIPFSKRFKIFNDNVVSLFTILWLVFGVGSAWRIASK